MLIINYLLPEICIKIIISRLLFWFFTSLSVGLSYKQACMVKKKKKSKFNAPQPKKKKNSFNAVTVNISMDNPLH